MTQTNHHARQARVRRSLDGVVASYIRDISKTGAVNGGVRALPARDRRAVTAALAADRDRAAA